MNIEYESRKVIQWITECLPQDQATMVRLRNLKHIAQREVWECEIALDGKSQPVILTIFKPGPTDNVITSQPSEDTARKCALAQQELSRLGIPTPKVLGLAIQEETAAILTERIEQAEWRSQMRVKAARLLARLHSLNLDRCVASTPEIGSKIRSKAATYL